MDLRPYKAAYKVNLVSTKGGRWHLPLDLYPHFLEWVWHNCESTELYFSEVSQPDTRLFFDFDSDAEIPRLREMLEAIVNEMFAGSWRATMGHRDGANNVHAVFPGLIVARSVLKAVTKTVSETLPADLAASGLRLPGCLSKSGDPAYFPLTDDLSIHRQWGEDHAVPIMDPRASRVNSTKALFPSLPAKRRRELAPRPCKADAEIQHIRTLAPEWAQLQVDKATMIGQDLFITVKGPGNRHCKMHGKPHSSNRIYFRVGRLFTQCCFACKGKSIVLQH